MVIYYSCDGSSPSYNCTGWLGTKHKITYYLSRFLLHPPFKVKRWNNRPIPRTGEDGREYAFTQQLSKLWYLQFYSRGMRERTIAFTSIQNRTLLLGAHPGSEWKVNFHHMANDTLPLVFHTKRHGRLICTCEEADAIRVRVLRVVTSKMGWPQRILSKTWGCVCALSEFSWSQGMGKTSTGFCYRLLRRSVTRCSQR